MNILKYSFSAALIVIATFLVACQHHQQTHSEKEVRFTILHTNDHHGRFWANKDGEYGMAARKTLIDNIRAELAAEGRYSLLLSGGDINTGIPESDALDAEPDFKGMALLGYDAMAVGNHEFDNSVATIRKQESWANFPFLAANIYDDNNERLFEPYKIFDFDGFKIGVIGLITHETAFIGNRKFVSGLTFTLPEKETAGIIDEVKQNSDITLALTHMGHSDSDLGSDVSLAKSVAGLDMIIGGHSAQAICVDEDGQVIKEHVRGDSCVPDKVNGTWIMQAEEWGRYLGRADFIYQSNTLTLESYQLIPVNLRNDAGEFVRRYIQPDKLALDLLSPFQKAGQEALSEVIGESLQDFERYTKDYLPNAFPLGQLVCEAMREATNANIAFYNRGGLRSALDKGDITVREILTLQPFRNTIVLKTFTGSELKQYLSAIKLLPNNKKEMQFSGMHINDRNEIIINSTQDTIRADEKYTVALNDFMAHGGDGYPALNDTAHFVDTGLLDYQVLIDFIKENSPIGSIKQAAAD